MDDKLTIDQKIKKLTDRTRANIVKWDVLLSDGVANGGRLRRGLDTITVLRRKDREYVVQLGRVGPYNLVPEFISLEATIALHNAILEQHQEMEKALDQILDEILVEP